ncbi:DNA mismatch repair protein MSH2, putative [Trypanosoma equiperdum]|uniref:DNA mismatch repair protein, putative n=2 Tax=Trypanozoon TaxID=39700 RepID=Q389N7_TRYB2|nr:DNA mismatch repair protein, putative [Trypanosoma brucei brucei TREU927]EAN78483.1 DNA mismatch repair protein, putative [Trypanosoma brucei brucei TREU927]SCU72454.1 DNA mismatch repair protein MSH2, putative [Trypanosoma equiperdum]
MSDDRDPAVVQAFNGAGGDDTSCLRLFSRASAGCFILGSWASLVAREYVKSTAVLKNWSGVDAVAVNDSITREVIRDCLLRRGVSVEQYDRQTSGGRYVCMRRGSPGHIADFEAMLFAFEDAEIQLMAIGSVVIDDKANRVNGPGGQHVRVGYAALNTTLRTLTYAEYHDTPQLTNLDVLMAQCNLKQLLYSNTDFSMNNTGEKAADSDESREQSDLLRALKQLCERANITLQERGQSNLPHGKQKSRATKRNSTGPNGELLSTLEGILRVPEDRHGLNSFPLASRALESLLESAIDPFDSTNQHTFYLKHVVPSTFMKMDAAAIEALHIIHRKPEARGSMPTSIYSWLNRCTTGMGSRLMQQWLLQPLRSIEDINQRLSLVQIMVESPILRDALITQVLRRCTDMDRLNRKLQRRTVALKDLQSILVFANTVPLAVDVLRTYHGGHDSSLLLKGYVTPLEDISEHLSNLRTLINATVDLSDENTVRINPEFDDDLSFLERQRQNLVKAIEKENHRVLKQCGWTEKQMKCEYHASYGYVFRVPRKDDHQVRTSKEFITVSTAKDGVRFVSGQLSSLSEQYKGITEDYKTRQQVLKKKLVDTVATYLPVLDDAKELLAALDVFAAWALVVKDSSRPMVRPTVRAPQSEEVKGNVDNNSNGAILTIVNARHPLVELRQPAFTPNTVQLTNEANALIITGPNMGGKSTFMRSIGVCVALAQAGCFVPADSADIVVRDAIMCRVGATDHLAQGVSTFMVEMLESAAMLNSATQQTLAIVDELGRGTSTYDGFGLAWAIAQEVAVNAKSALLFSTHFHEMTQLAARHTNVRNVHFGADVDTAARTLRFSYQLQPGPCGRSYGLYVAQLAHIPDDVLDSARQKAVELEDFGGDETKNRAQALFSTATPEVVQRVTEYAKRIRELESGEGDGDSREAARRRLCSEIKEDALLSSLVEV